nr:7TM GPCR domain containing protein [Haemonchus contortus]
MQSSGSIKQDLSLEYCIENGVVPATAWYYRASLLFSLITSSVSVGYMLYFLHNCSTYSAFFQHNLRMLFFSMCLCCLMYDFMNIIMKIHHLGLTFLYAEPCNIFLPKTVYIAMHLPTIFVLVASQCMQLAVITERWIANFYRISYESCFRKLGPVLIAAAIITTVCILLITYYGERFNGPHLNGRWFSVKDIVRTNMVLMSLLIMNFIGLILTLALRYFCPKRKIGMSLSSKLQANENTTVSNFLFWISVFQFAMLFLSEAALLYLRIYQSINPLVTAYKENADLFNYYTLALPILSMLYIRKAKQQRITHIKKNMNMKAVGNEGWANYLTVIQKQWK